MNTKVKPHNGFKPSEISKKLNVFGKKLQKFKKFGKKIVKILKFCLFFVVSGLIEKIFLSTEVKIDLKINFVWHHVETIIQNFE